jgi:hypothetical protein
MFWFRQSGPQGGTYWTTKRPQSRATYFRDVANMLRGLADEQRYDVHRRDQLLALADGFERFAARLEQEANA